MAKFCMNCGSELTEGSVFCPKCGSKVNETPSKSSSQPQQSAHPIPQPNLHSYHEAVKPGHVNKPYTPQPPKKKKTGLIIALISVGAALTIFALVIIFIVLAPLMRPHNIPPTEAISLLATEAPTEISAQTEAPTSAPVTEAEKPTEAPAPQTQAPAPLPYADNLGSPSAEDFIWISDAMSGQLEGSFLSNDELVGKWKGEIIYDGVWELVIVTIDRNAQIIIEPVMINYGDGWEDERGSAPYIFSGGFDVSSVSGTGEYGTVSLYTFVESYGTQYGVGSFSVQNGNSANIYMVRP